MGLLGVCYKELGLVRIWTRIGHGHHTAGVELGSDCQLRETLTGKGSGGQPYAVPSEDVEMADGPRFFLTLMVDRISSSKGLAQMDWPPLPVPLGSPVWIIKALMLRWKMQPS